MRLTSSARKEVVDALAHKAGFQARAKEAVAALTEAVELEWKDYRETHWTMFEMALKKTALIIRQALPHQMHVIIRCETDEQHDAAVWAGLKSDWRSSCQIKLDMKPTPVPQRDSIVIQAPAKHIKALAKIHAEHETFVETVAAIVNSCTTAAQLAAKLPGAEAFLPLPEKKNLPAVIVPSDVKAQLAIIGVRA